MKIKTVSGMMLTLLLVGTFTLAFNIQSAKAEPTTIIVPDDYEKIKWAIGNASDGDTIFVRAGTYVENVVVSKSVQLIGEDPATTIIDGSGTGYVIDVKYTSNVNITGFTIRNGSDFGICLRYLYIWANIFGNIIKNNGRGIGFWFAHCNISENTIKDNKGTGIALQDGYAGISGNNVENNGGTGISLGEAAASISENNIKGNNGHGVYLGYSAASISGNNIEGNNGDGVCLGWWSSGSVFENHISDNNGTGIAIWYALNSIYHNNFINNNQQVYVAPGHLNFWDDGYPYGGNYWSDYTAVDEFSGPNQDESGADGIIDTPYTIDAGNQDNYPLMKPYGGAHDIGITGIRSETILVSGCTLDINITVLNYGFYTETFNLTAYANTTVISQTEVTLSSRNSATITSTWDTTGVTLGNYIISAYATPVPNEIDRADNYFEDGVVTIATPEYLTQKLVETIETWNLRKGTENSLAFKLDDALHLLNKGNENGAIHKLMDFIDQVEALQDKKITHEQAVELIAEAQRIIDLIKG